MIQLSLPYIAPARARGAPAGGEAESVAAAAAAAGEIGGGEATRGGRGRVWGRSGGK